MQYFGDNGIIKKAQQAKGLYENSVLSEEVSMNTLLAEYENMMAEPEEPPTGPNGKQLVTSVTDTNHDTITAEDEKGNQVVVPGGFKVRTDLGDTVQDGIVIEDSDGNQFVWIPVSNTNGDESNKIILDNGNSVEITLGRYTFDTSDGTPTIQQYGANYTDTDTDTSIYENNTGIDAVIIEFWEELSKFRESNQVNDETGTNATAKDLAGFVRSVATYHGYYLARYEASYASGSEYGVGNDSKFFKPASKVSTAIGPSEDDNADGIPYNDYAEGALWVAVTQGNASMASRQMYYGNNYVESDLVNSYAWDTAIVYIQAMGNSNYANAFDSYTGVFNTGETEDIKCNVYDMAGNFYEWSTEFHYLYRSGYKSSDPCVARKGSDKYYNGVEATFCAGVAFRVTLYVAI